MIGLIDIHFITVAGTTAFIVGVWYCYQQWVLGQYDPLTGQQIIIDVLVYGTVVSSFALLQGWLLAAVPFSAVLVLSGGLLGVVSAYTQYQSPAPIAIAWVVWVVAMSSIAHSLIWYWPW